MSELSPKLKDALSQVQAPWDDARSERTLRALPRRRHRQRLRTALVAGTGALLSLGCVVWLLREPAQHSASARTPASQHEGVLAPGSTRAALRDAPLAGAGAPSDAPDTQRAAPEAPEPALSPRQQLRLPDGSKVALLQAESDVVVERSDDRLVAVRVGAGHARFEVPALGDRVFQLRTAQVVCEVLGATFEVAQHAESTWLHVERGRVVVAAADSRRALEAGDEAWFPAVPALGAREQARFDNGKAGANRKLAARAASRASAGSAVSAHEPDQADTAWREHAERGDFKGAFPLLPARNTVAAMNVSELLLAADAARLSGHPDAALPYLRRVVEEHAQDARAPLAAFTLGGVLMHQLGMPREAEAAYARARATSLSGALAEDALARQVEAAHRAGDEALARSLARDYLERYPQGRRVHAVRRFGGL